MDANFQEKKCNRFRQALADAQNQLIEAMVREEEYQARIAELETQLAQKER